MQEPQLNSLYQQLILDHYRSPRNKGEMDDPHVEVHMRNPSCGDEIKLQLRVEHGRITDVRFTGQGCSISQAAVSMMTQLLTGKPLDDVGSVGAFLAEADGRRLRPPLHRDDAWGRGRGEGPEHGGPAGSCGGE